MLINKTELLSPAGSMEALRAAIRFGADAVYIGGSFMQLRAAGVGFDNAGITEAVSFAHSQGKKVYVALNCCAQNSEITKIKEYAVFLYSAGVDAVIIADLGVLTAVKKAEPRLEVHISTQVNCMNYLTAELFYNLGAKRIVLARELKLEDIAEIRIKTPAELELEAFIHGAMCMAYSGRCLISSYLTNRSGNRGECAQPCRWNYHLVEEKRPGEFFTIDEGENGTAILSSHDLCTIDFIDKIAEAGVTSFKIEGRMKTPYYVAAVTRAYRKRMDGYSDTALLRDELETVSHRPYSSGFYFGEMKDNHYNDGLYHQNAVIAAVVVSCGEGYADIEQKNRFSVGDRLEILEPEMHVRSFIVENIAGDNGESRENAPHPKEKLRINCPFRLEPGDMLRKRI